MKRYFKAVAFAIYALTSLYSKQKKETKKKRDAERIKWTEEIRERGI
jgi:ribosomal protein L24E